MLFTKHDPTATVLCGRTVQGEVMIQTHFCSRIYFKNDPDMKNIPYSSEKPIFSYSAGACGIKEGALRASLSAKTLLFKQNDRMKQTNLRPGNKISGLQCLTGTSVKYCRNIAQGVRCSKAAKK